MKIITRARWGARPPKTRITTVWGRRTEFVVHHTEGPTTQTLASIQDFHMDVRRWSDIAYNFLVTQDGQIWEGRGWLTIGAHATGHNTSGIGVAYVGTNSPSDAALHSIRALYDYACAQAGHALLKRGHGQLSQNNTDCPGPALLAWVKAGLPDPTRPTPPTVPATAPPWPGRVLRLAAPMMHGPDVLAWQRQMAKRGWTITADGFYTVQSQTVCALFQQDSTAHDWPLDDDGEVGEHTWKAAFERPIS